MIRLEPLAAPQFNQPLGFMYLAAALRRAGYWNIQIVDLAPQRITWKTILNRVAQAQPDIVFLTAYTIEMARMARFSRLLHEASPGTMQIIGGSHPTGDPVGTLEALPRIAAAVAGEGEESTVELLARLGGNGHRPNTVVPGTAVRTAGGEIAFGGPRPIPDSLDDSLWPAYDLIDVPAYFRYPRMGVLFKNREYMSLFTSRGCSYGCDFCHEVFGRRYRAHSVERVLEEMAYLVRRYGIREFQIADDLFNGDDHRTETICSGILRRGLSVALTFPNGLRADRLTTDEIAALKAAGTYRICVAPETATERLQRQIGKNNDLEAIRRAIEACDERGILTSGFFMLGFPSETREEMMATVQWALDSRLHTANFFRVVPFPGSKLRAKAQRMGLEVDSDSEDFEAGGTRFNLTDLPGRQVEHIQRLAIRAFYRDPGRLARLLLVLPRRPELLPQYASEFFVRILLGTVVPQLEGKLGGTGGWRAVWDWFVSAHEG